MALKRTSNVFSFSEDSEGSDGDDVSYSVKSNKKPRLQSEFAQNHEENKVLRHNSSSCDENVLHTNRRFTRNRNESRECYKKRVCNSKNAIMARENRMKKKLYVDGLENQIDTLKKDNKKMRSTLGTQCNYISEMEKEIRYLRNVLANTKEISMLIGTIGRNTGLAVSTSLNASQFESNLPSIDRRTIPTARKTAHAFDDVDLLRDTQTPPTSISSLSPSHLDEEAILPFDLDVMPYLSDDNLPIALDDVNFSPFYDAVVKADSQIPVNNKAEVASLDHNYSKHDLVESNELSGNQFGICLHIANKKLSLEFCSKCNEKALMNWDSVTC